MAAELDGEFRLVAGAFSSDPARSIAGGARYGVPPERSYPSVPAMIAGEAARADGVEMVVVATPNHLHLAASRTALEAGLAVMSDKPAAATLTQARELATAVKAARRPYGLTYSYCGYPLVREARARITAGAIGRVRKVVVEYAQGWLSGDVASKQAEWRLDPARAGPGGCIADIGVHAFHLTEFVTGMRVTQVLPDLGRIVPGRTLDDDCQLFLRFGNGARGVLLASQIMTGEQNALRIRVYGETGSLDWRQEQPNALIHRQADRLEVIRAGTDAAASPEALAGARLPGGHPEGYIEALANLYRDMARTLRGETGSLLPGIADGLRGMALVDAAVRADSNDPQWVDLPTIDE
jgi:predicted dehydrogenase